MTKQSVLLICILCLGSFIRLWQLGSVPVGFYSDEALYGYEAYSLLRTGRDQFGNPWPLSIAGFGDYRPALYIYATIPFVAVFGLTEFAVRLPSALSSIATLIFVYLFTKKIIKQERVALLVLLFLSISPWHIFFGRMAHETNLMTMLILAGIFFLVRAQKCKPCLFMAMIFFSASLYTYHTARVFVPLFLLLTALIFRSYIRRNIILIGSSSLLFIILSLPLVFEYSNGQGWSRVNGVSLWGDPGIISQVNETRGKLLEQYVPPMVARIISNKANALAVHFATNILSHFSPSFLLLQGDPNGVYNTPDSGIIFWVEPLLLFIGACVLWKKNRSLCVWILGAVFIGLIPDSLTRVSPSSARIHLLAPFIALLNGIGLHFLFKRNKQLPFILIIILCINIAWFWKQYLFALPIERAYAWQAGTKEMVIEAERMSKQYPHIWISRSGWGWIHYVFHTGYDPEKLQQEIQVSGRNELGFWWVSDIGKIHFDWLPKKYNPDTLYVGLPEELSPYMTPSSEIKRVVKDLQGKDLYWFVDGKSLTGSML